MTGELRSRTGNQALDKAFERLDAEARDHSVRVSSYSAILARAMDMSAERVATIVRGALLHEIGVLAIPEAIVHKPAQLTVAEQAIMREHCVRGYPYRKLKVLRHEGGGWKTIALCRLYL